MLSLDDLRKEVEDGTIDTVVTAFTDMQGRLFGKRIQDEYFLDEVVEHGVEGCNYLLALDMEMDPVPGYEMAELGERLRRLRDQAGHGDAAPDPVARPNGAGALRRRQPRRLARSSRRRARSCRRLRARRRSWASRRRAPPSSSSTSSRRPTPRPTRRTTRDLDADDPLHPRLPLLATAMDEAYLGADPPRDARRRHPGRVLEGRVQLVGQHEVNSRYADARQRPPTATRSTRTASRRSPPRRGISTTFMAKPNEKEGNSCHIHSASSTTTVRASLSTATRDRRLPTTSSPACSRRMRELALFFAPYDQLLQALRAESSLRPPRSPGAATTAPARCGSSAMAQSLRVENRIPGADVNPYLALRGDDRRRPDGIENEPEPEPAFEGNAYEADKPAVPLDPARGARPVRGRASSPSDAFGEEVVDHYLNRARSSIDGVESTVTDWERFRGFERL